MNISPTAESYILDIPKGGAGEQRGCNRTELQPGTLGGLRQRYLSPRLVPVELIDDLPGIRRVSIHVLESSPAAEATSTITGNNALAKAIVGAVRRIVEFDGINHGILGGATEHMALARADHAADPAGVGACRAGDLA